jgi:hypothetical protein
VLLEQQRCAGGGALPIDDRRKRFDLDIDQIERVLGNLARLRDDDRDRLADETDLVGGDRPLQKALHARHRRKPQRDERQRVEIGAAEYRDHAGQIFGGRHVDAADVSVRERTAQHRRMHQPFRRDIIDVSAAPAQQPQVLHALDRLSEIHSRISCGARLQDFDLPWWR